MAYLTLPWLRIEAGSPFQLEGIPALTMKGREKKNHELRNCRDLFLIILHLAIFPQKAIIPSQEDCSTSNKAAG